MSDIKRLREIAAKAAHQTDWSSSRNRHPNTDGTPWGAVEWEQHPAGGAGKRIFAWSGYGAEADAKHVATFDPPTVLALLDRLEAAEAAIERVRSRERGPMRRDQATDQPCRACPFAACGGCGYQTETSNETSREAL